MWPKTKNFKMATGPKAGLYQNAQSASYLPPTLEENIKPKKHAGHPRWRRSSLPNQWENVWSSNVFIYWKGGIWLVKIITLFQTLEDGKFVSLIVLETVWHILIEL